MNGITTYNSSITAPVFSAQLFHDFVAWIDRNEQTTKNYLRNLKQFAVWLQYAGIDKPERKDIISYREWLIHEHDAIAADKLTGWKYRTTKSGERVKLQCKPTTVQAYLQSVSAFFKWTAAAGYYPNIATNIHAPKAARVHRKDALTAQEVLTIEDSIQRAATNKSKAAANASKDTAGRIQRSTEQGKRLYAMYLLAVNAGLRTVELSRANVKDFQTRNGQAWLYVWGKGHSEADQKKALAPEIAAAIKDYLQSRTDVPTGNSPLFVSTGNRSGGKRIASTTISKQLKQAMIDAGYNSDRLTAHSLRHTAGTAAYQLTGNLYAVQQYMRHINPATTEIYMHVNTDTWDAEIAQQLYNSYHGIS